MRRDHGGVGWKERLAVVTTFGAIRHARYIVDGKV
jgi:hypothetical protein